MAFMVRNGFVDMSLLTGSIYLSNRSICRMTYSTKMEEMKLRPNLSQLEQYFEILRICLVASILPQPMSDAIIANATEVVAQEVTIPYSSRDV